MAPHDVYLPGPVNNKPCFLKVKKKKKKAVDRYTQEFLGCSYVKSYEPKLEGATQINGALDMEAG